MRGDSAGRAAGGLIAAVGLIGAVAGGLFGAPAYGATSTTGHVAVEDAGTTGAGTNTGTVEGQGEPAEGTPGTGSSWTVRRSVTDGVTVTVTGAATGRVPEAVTGSVSGAVSGSVDTGLPIGSSWT
ncbi:hypothetical protein [Cryptosporangium minutisporangium]|uniref:DUF5666 domain-containing protein n=1 Tax=Cryptosporangium minutisporangium TaxID=113569 RepID=A0ABP6TCL2_9ACTN